MPIHFRWNTARFAMLCSLLAAVSACQRQLPIVDDGFFAAAGAPGTGVGGRGASSGTASGTSSSSSSSESNNCVDRGPAQVIRANRDGGWASQLIATRNGLIFSESKPSTKNIILAIATSTEILYTLSLDGKREQVLFAPDPPTGLRNLYATDDTLFFITWEPGVKSALYSLSLEGGERKLLQRFEDQNETPAPFAADDEYVYIYQSFRSKTARISRRDGTRTELPATSSLSAYGVTMYQNNLWYLADERLDMRPTGVYQVDPRAPMPTEVRVGERTCSFLANWALTSDYLFCAQARSINRWPLRSGANAQDTVIYSSPRLIETGNLQFSQRDGDFVYFRSELTSFPEVHPIRRLNLQTSAIDVVSCGRKQTEFIIGTATHIYWIETRHGDDSSLDGIYRIAKP